MDDASLAPGVYSDLVTRELAALLANPVLTERAMVAELRNADAADRLSTHVARALSTVINGLPEEERAASGALLVEALLARVAELHPDAGLDAARLVPPARLLDGVRRERPDGSLAPLDLPLTSILDTTVLTNARGEPTVQHEVIAEIPSAERVDVLMAFVRWSGVRPLVDALRRHCRRGGQVRLLTTTYTNSTEARALDELVAIGVDVRVSYDTSTTRLHAKSWIFHRPRGATTAYIGSSNLTHSAQVTGLEWNVRVAGLRNPDVVAKMAAVFETYWESDDFVPYVRVEFIEWTRLEDRSGLALALPPTELHLHPFQERLLERIAAARTRDHHRNLLVAATGTGKTVMAAVDYARLRATLPRARLLFVAHRHEILERSRLTFRHALRDASFGELWVGSHRPTGFEHVFASIQSLGASGLAALAADHFDVVIVDEFHHAAAPSYRTLLEHVRPAELLGLTATPERADGLDVREFVDGRIAAELRIWDAIDQQYLVPFTYYGIHDGLDLTQVPWKRGRGYDVEALTNVLTADDIWVAQVVQQLHDRVADVGAMRALGFCVSVEHARFMADRFAHRGISARWLSGESSESERREALLDLAAGRVAIIFTVDLFNEGIDVPTVDTIVMLRPTESATLFLQQLGRGLRRAHDKATCTVLDFVGTHRREFRFDLCYRALLGGSRKDIQTQIERGVPFLPSGCHFDLDPVARQIVLDSIRNAIPTRWPERVAELRSIGDVDLRTFLDHSGLELDDIYASDRSWSELRRAADLPTFAAGEREVSLLRAVGRLRHVDDVERLTAYRSFVDPTISPDSQRLPERDRRLLRMFLASMFSDGAGLGLESAWSLLRSHRQVCAEVDEVLAIALEASGDHVQPTLGEGNVPLHLHARYTRVEIQAALGDGSGLRPPRWDSGVKWLPGEQTDIFAFTLDKTSGDFSPTTRYRDYAISRDLIHWESQTATSVPSPTGQRYLHHAEQGSSVMLFARLRADERSLWFLGPATYVRHEGDRPIAITWRLHHRLPQDLFAAFAAAVG